MVRVVLAVDIGNSNTTLGLFQERGTLLFLSALATNQNKTKDQYALDLLGVLQLYGADVTAIDGAIISSVVPPLTQTMTDAVTRLIRKPPMVVGPGIKTGLNIKAEIHNQLGSDIVASSVAAMAKYPSPVILIDMGTATAMSLLVGSSYEGCSIMPGLRLGLNALSERAAELPHISIETGAPVGVLGRTTEDAMRAGTLYGHAAMVDGMIARLEEASAPVTSVVATGENALRILKYCKRDVIYDENLLMDGLYLLYQKNAERNHRR